jgi:hypothetical protein
MLIERIAVEVREARCYVGVVARVEGMATGHAMTFFVSEYLRDSKSPHRHLLICHYKDAGEFLNQVIEHYRLPAIQRFCGDRIERERKPWGVLLTRSVDDEAALQVNAFQQELYPDADQQTLAGIPGEQLPRLFDPHLSQLDERCLG